MMPTIVRCSQRGRWGGEDLVRRTLSLRATAEEQMFPRNLHCGAYEKALCPCLGHFTNHLKSS